MRRSTTNRSIRPEDAIAKAMQKGRMERMSCQVTLPPRNLVG